MEYTTKQNMNTKKTMSGDEKKKSKKSEKKTCLICYGNLKKSSISCPGC